MATKLSILKRDLMLAAKKTGSSPGHKFLVDISAGYGLAHSRLVEDIESMDSAVDNIGTDIDFTPRVAEVIKHLPVISEQYYLSLVRLGVVGDVANCDKKENVTTDDDALALLRNKVNGL